VSPDTLNQDAWVWDALEASWEEGFSHLTAYVQAEGHARVPQSHRTADGYPLGRWVGHQRTAKDKLSAERRQRLDGMKGWVWSSPARPSKHARKIP